MIFTEDIDVCLHKVKKVNCEQTSIIEQGEHYRNLSYPHSKRAVVIVVVLEVEILRSKIW